MKKIIQFFKECYAELLKVVWPSRSEVSASIKVVFASVIFFAVLFGVVDYLLLAGSNYIF